MFCWIYDIPVSPCGIHPSIIGQIVKKITSEREKEKEREAGKKRKNDTHFHAIVVHDSLRSQQSQSQSQ